MDQNELVRELIDDGERLIKTLVEEGIEVQLAFWAKPTEDGKWFLYIATTLVDNAGPKAAYRQVITTIRKMPDLWIDPLEVKVIGIKDSLAEAALNVVKPRVPRDSPYAGQNPKPRPGMKWVGATSFAGISMDGACIYPPSQPVAST